jgi:hypothetical protein
MGSSFLKQARTSLVLSQHGVNSAILLQTFEQKLVLPDARKYSTALLVHKNPLVS